LAYESHFDVSRIIFVNDLVPSVPGRHSSVTAAETTGKPGIKAVDPTLAGPTWNARSGNADPLKTIPIYGTKFPSVV